MPTSHVARERLRWSDHRVPFLTLFTGSRETETYQHELIHRDFRANTMNKASLTAAITAGTGLTTKKAKAALEATLKAMKQGLKDDRSIDLGRLGKLRTAKLDRGRRVSRGLRNVGASVFDYSKHAKTVKLKSKLDLSKDPLPTIVHPVPAKPRYIKKLCAIAYPRWRRRTTRG